MIARSSRAHRRPAVVDAQTWRREEREGARACAGGAGDRGAPPGKRGGRLHVAPKVDTPEVLEPDSTKTEDDEVLYLDDRLDRAVSASRDVLFLKNSGGLMLVGECFWDRFFNSALGGVVS